MTAGIGVTRVHRELAKLRAGGLPEGITCYPVTEDEDAALEPSTRSPTSASAPPSAPTRNGGSSTSPASNREATSSPTSSTRGPAPSSGGSGDRMPAIASAATPRPTPAAPMLSLSSSSSVAAATAPAATLLHATLTGPPSSPYAGGTFRLRLRVPERYPFVPPMVVFVTPVYHPNIDPEGRICLDVLKLPPAGGWRPSLTLGVVLAAVRQLLREPNPSDPLRAEVAAEYLNDPSPKGLFWSQAARHTRQHATRKRAADDPSASVDSLTDSQPASKRQPGT